MIQQNPIEAVTGEDLNVHNHRDWAKKKIIIFL